MATQALKEAIAWLNVSATRVTTLVATTISPDTSPNMDFNRNWTNIESLRANTMDLKDISEYLDQHADDLHWELTESVRKYIKPLGFENSSTYRENEVVEELLLHFESHLMKIIRKQTLGDAADEDLLWKILEECHKQASGRDGELDALGYYHNNTELFVDRSAAFVNASWLRYWSAALRNSRRGPTLFEDSINCPDRYKSDMPPYLFRVYDRASSGLNSGKEITSAAYQANELGCSENILDKSPYSATSQLYRHLRKKEFEEDSENCLVSWTSSFLFAIQYAIHRYFKDGGECSDIKICVIKTSNYPATQFMLDNDLMRIYLPYAQALDPEIFRFFKLLTNRRSDNGEYLSQGRLSIEGRSSVVSLQALINSGLFELHPELAERPACSLFKRLKDLRELWDIRRETSRRDLELVSEIAKSFGEDGYAPDLALMLLGFCHRAHEHSAPHGIQPIATMSNREPAWAKSVAEVSDYWHKTECLRLGCSGIVLEDIS